MAKKVLTKGRAEGMPCSSACRKGARNPDTVISGEGAKVLGAGLDPVIGAESLDQIVFKTTADVEILKFGEGKISAPL